METLTVKSQVKYQLIDITDKVADVISKSAIKSGIILVYVPHTTAGIVCNEDEARLKSDILKVPQAVEKHSDIFGGFEHDRDEGRPAGEAGNAHAHIASALSGSSRCFIIAEGELQLGTWQSIMFLEMGGPRSRQVWVKIIPYHL